MLPQMFASTVKWLVRPFFNSLRLFNNNHTLYAINGDPEQTSTHDGYEQRQGTFIC